MRKWTLQDLIDVVSEAIYENGGIDKGISRRSIQMDIQLMRSDQLGYNAPIIVVGKKYYTYENPNYSITKIPLNDQDLARMNEAVEVLKQFKGFSHFTSLNEVVQKLEDHVYAAAHHTQSVIEFEKNERLRGLEYLDMLYQSIIHKKAINVDYQSFKAKEAHAFEFHVWWLKEFRNRWFAVGVKSTNNDKGKGRTIMHLALDRISALELLDSALYIENDSIIATEYYKYVIGVTVSHNIRPSNVRLWVNSEHAPYILTKPMHHSQVMVQNGKDGAIINIYVQLNLELEREILGYGDGMIVLSPESLRRKIQRKLQKGVSSYDDSITRDKTL
jgi:predicted DNA-binding transcriptional regulator YafY